MAIFLKTNLQRWSVVTLVLLLGACAIAPGMRMDNDEASTKGADASMLKVITPQLLQNEQLMREQQVDADISPLMHAATPYHIGNGDILSIIVWDHPELATPMMVGATQITTSGTDSGATPGFVVDQNGMVQFPYVGLLKLAGLTEAEARDVLMQKIGRYLKKPNLTLRVQAYRSQRVYISGEVKSQGIQAIDNVPMTLAEALNRAGGVLPTGDASQIEISRAGINYPINLPKLVRKGINPSNIMLVNGDAVRIFSRDNSKVFVLGEVSRPATLTLRDGHLTLGEALGEVGGLNSQTSNARQVYVVRNIESADSANGTQPQVYNLDARSPVAFALAENFQLKAKDVVYVDAAPLAVWSRVVSLIIPSALSVTSAVQAGK